MAFYDRAKITVKAGDGGAGSASMRREKYVSRGGPDGGDGGRGGNVFLRANPELNTLLPFYYRKQFVATNGGQGAHRKQHGANGADIYIDVPPGTQVRIISTDPLEADLITVTEADLIEPGRRYAWRGAARVGWVTSTSPPRPTRPRVSPKRASRARSAPRIRIKDHRRCGAGRLSQRREVYALAATSAARPEIADYPFTTLEPVLGVVSMDDDTFVVADIPGLIEGASDGQGAGAGVPAPRRTLPPDRPCARRRGRACFPGVRAEEAAALPADGAGRSPIPDFERINQELAQLQPLAGREAADRGRQQDGSP